MPGRKTITDDYRFAYNGMELDNEVRGNGGSYTTEFRQYDPRLGRWLSLDPLMNQFPWMSPYVAFNDNPTAVTDPTGQKGEGWGGKTDENGVTHWTYREDITAEHHEGYDKYMDEGLRENFDTKDGYKGPVYLEFDGTVTKGNSSKLAVNDLEDFTVTAQKPYVQPTDDHTGNVQHFDISQIDFTVNGSNRYSADPTEEMLRIRRKWDTFDKGMQQYFIAMATLPLCGEGVLATMIVNSGSNLGSQLVANDGDWNKVDVASTVIAGLTAFGPSGSIKGIIATSTTAALVDAGVDVNINGERTWFYEKKSTQFAADFGFGTLNNLGQGSFAKVQLGVKMPLHFEAVSTTLVTAPTVIMNSVVNNQINGK